MRKRGQSSFKPDARLIYLAFYKPYGVICQFTSDDGEKQTLRDFDFPKGVYSVGRLDEDSEGLLVLSNDPRLNQALLNPAEGHARTYLVQVESIPGDAGLERLRSGVVIKGEKTRPCRAELVPEEPDLPPRPVPIRFRKNIPTAWLTLTLTEGKNRQVRRMTASIGHPTLRLVRIAIGGVTIARLGLEPGQWRMLQEAEVETLFQAD